ncbi:unnamed protein product [Chrysoparadoxa australica]
MSSLRQQLTAIRAAATGTSSEYLQRRKGEASLLLNSTQAAGVDVTSVREAALEGLGQLCSLSEAFEEFREPLFSEPGEHRDLQTREVNDALNTVIGRFLQKLSPHLESNAAHLTLEYLVRQHRIYEHNVDQVIIMACILPWHDTKIFVKLIQLISLEGSRWAFLQPVQSSGSTLPRSALARQVMQKTYLPSFISLCHLAPCSCLSYPPLSSSWFLSYQGTPFGHLFSFYTAVMNEVLGQLTTLHERLMRSLLPTLLAGIGASSCSDFQLASYVIMSNVALKTHLSRKVSESTIKACVKYSCQSGPQPPLLCILAVVQGQGPGQNTDLDTSMENCLSELPLSAFKRLHALPGLADVLAEMSQSFDVALLVWLLVQRYVEHLGVLTVPGSGKGIGYADGLCALVSHADWARTAFPSVASATAELLLSSAISTDAGMLAKGATKADQKLGIVKVLSSMCQKYPAAVDAAVASESRKVANQPGEEGSGNEVASVALFELLSEAFALPEQAQHRPVTAEDGVSFDGVNTSLFLALEHPSPTVRAKAISQLGDAQSEAEPACASRDVLERLVARLGDDSCEVVSAVVGSEALVKALCSAADASFVGPTAAAANQGCKRWIGSLRDPHSRAHQGDARLLAKAGCAASGALKLLAQAVEAGGQSDYLLPSAVIECLPVASLDRAALVTGDKARDKAAKAALMSVALTAMSIAAGSSSSQPIFAHFEATIASDKKTGSVSIGKLARHCKAWLGRGLLDAARMALARDEDEEGGLNIEDLCKACSRSAVNTLIGAAAAALAAVDEAGSPEHIAKMAQNVAQLILKRGSDGEKELLSHLRSCIPHLPPPASPHSVVSPSRMLMELLSLPKQRPQDVGALLCSHYPHHPLRVLCSIGSGIGNGSNYCRKESLCAAAAYIEAAVATGPSSDFSEDICAFLPLVLVALSSNEKAVRSGALLVLKTLGSHRLAILSSLAPATTGKPGRKTKSPRKQAKSSAVLLNPKDLFHPALGPEGAGTKAADNFHSCSPENALDLVAYIVAVSSDELTFDGEYISRVLRAVLDGAEAAGEMAATYARHFDEPKKEDLTSYLQSYGCILGVHCPVQGLELLRCLPSESSQGLWMRGKEVLHWYMLGGGIASRSPGSQEVSDMVDMLFQCIRNCQSKGGLLDGMMELIIESLKQEGLARRTMLGVLTEDWCNDTLSDDERRLLLPELLSVLETGGIGSEKAMVESLNAFSTDASIVKQIMTTALKKGEGFVTSLLDFLRITGFSRYREATRWSLGPPLFQLIVELPKLSVASKFDGSAADYCLAQAMDALSLLLRSDNTGGLDAKKVGHYAKVVLAAIDSQVASQQTRNSGLLLMARMAEQHPAVMQESIMQVLTTVAAQCAAVAPTGTTGTGGGGHGLLSDNGPQSQALSLVQGVVQRVVPVIRKHGSASGVRAQSVSDIFVRAIDGIPEQYRMDLFRTLLSALGRDAAPTLAMALIAKDEGNEQVRSDDDDGDDSMGEDNGTSSSSNAQIMTRFAHELLSNSCGPHHQVKTVLCLLRGCHRVVVQTAGDASLLDGQDLAVVLEELGNEEGQNQAGEYTNLPLCVTHLSSKRHRSKSDQRLAAFLVVDLKENTSISLVKRWLTFSRDHLLLQQLHWAIANADPVEAKAVQRDLILVCEALLKLVRTLEVCGARSSSGDVDFGAEAASVTDGGELRWMVCEVMDTLQMLLSVPSFVAVIQELLQHESVDVRQKALRMLSTRLEAAQSSGGFDAEEQRLFLDMISDLRAVINPSLSPNQDQGEPEQGSFETALVSIDILAKCFGDGCPEEFEGVLEDISKTLNSDVSVDDRAGVALASSSFLCIAALCSTLKARAFPRLSTFLPPMLGALEASLAEDIKAGLSHQLLQMSVLASLATISQALPQFLHPYISRILAALLHPSLLLAAASSPKIASNLQRILDLTALGVRPRLLLPALGSVYPNTASGGARSTCKLMQLLKAVVEGMEHAEVEVYMPQATNLLLLAMDWRRSNPEADSADKDLVDFTVGEALVGLVLRLNESQLRPMFLRLCDWSKALGDGGSGESADEEQQSLDRRITLFTVAGSLSEALRGLFVPYFGYLQSDAAAAMEVTAGRGGGQVSIADSNANEMEVASSRKKRRKKSVSSKPAVVTTAVVTEKIPQQVLLVKKVLVFMSKCCQFDTEGFMDAQRFDLLMKPLVDQIDAPLLLSLSSTKAQVEGEEGTDSKDGYRAIQEAYVSQCIGQFCLSLSLGRDTMWKHLVQSVLLKTRDTRSAVRLAALSAVWECFNAVGEELLVLLPDSLPFFSELLEDEDSEVEALCRKTIKLLEELLGESLEDSLAS